MLCRVRFRAIWNGFRTEIFEKFRDLQNFAFEIARDRAEIHAAWWCAASLLPLEVPYICCERQNAVPFEVFVRFGTDFGSKFSKNFATCKILRSKSREIAPKLMPPGGAQLPHDP